MTRCAPAHACATTGLHHHGAVRRYLLALSFVGLVAGAMLPMPVSAQTPPIPGAARNFPEAALRGALVITGQGMATINGNAIRLAPGMRLFNAQNQLTMLHTVIGQKFTVNYLIEPSTGMLWTAWVLTPTEAAQERKGSGVQRNFSFDSDSTTTR